MFILPYCLLFYVCTSPHCLIGILFCCWFSFAFNHRFIGFCAALFALLQPHASCVMAIISCGAFYRHRHLAVLCVFSPVPFPPLFSLPSPLRKLLNPHMAAIELCRQISESRRVTVNFYDIFEAIIGKLHCAANNCKVFACELNI